MPATSVEIRQVTRRLGRRPAVYVIWVQRHGNWRPYVGYSMNIQKRLDDYLGRWIPMLRRRGPESPNRAFDQDLAVSTDADLLFNIVARAPQDAAEVTVAQMKQLEDAWVHQLETEGHRLYNKAHTTSEGCRRLVDQPNLFGSTRPLLAR